jgi:hypothetical protein
MKKIFPKNISIYAVIILSILFNSCSKKTDNLDLIKLLPENEYAEVNKALESAGNNAVQLTEALENCTKEQSEGMLFLLKNMPERDLQSLSSEFLLDNIKLSYSILDSVRWGKEIPKEIFLNYVLPYVNLHERRDNWREDFYNKFYPLIKNSETPSEAVLYLNEKVWDILNVHYSTKRPKADQSPYESIDASLASCTGLSILLIDICRAVGIPARFVGVPLWKDQSGNHSWVEIWDDGWHFIGAAEQSPLNETWFGERAKTSDDSNWKYSIYASSFKKTDVVFPPLFDSSATYVYADIVTDRYSEELIDDGLVALGIRLFNKKDGKRIIGNIEIRENGKVVANGETRNEKRDFNDLLVFRVKPSSKFEIVANSDNKIVKKEVEINNSKYQFVELYLEE